MMAVKNPLIKRGSKEITKAVSSALIKHGVWTPKEREFAIKSVADAMEKRKTHPYY
jgi:hypothetical protein